MKKGIGTAGLVGIGIVVYILATIAFYFLMEKPAPPTPPTAEEILDSLSLEYMLDIDRMKNDDDFIAALRSKVSDTDITDKTYELNADSVQQELGLHDTVFNDSIFRKYAEDVLVDEKFIEYIEKNREKLELLRDKKILSSEIEKLESKIDTLEDKTQLAISENLSKSDSIALLKSEKENLEKKTEEMSLAEVVATARKFDQMKAPEAARIMNKLSDTDAVNILKRMKTRQAARLMTALPSSRSARLTKKMMEKK